jgi:sulfite reductase alpha subunit-like flavoprotein
MARDVHKALVALLAFKATSAPEEEASGEETLTEAGAEAWLQAMKDDGKYVQDIWS